jgi:ribosomal protein S18 acetylase RimI-like enzyme
VIIEITSENPDSAIRELLSYATFSERVNQVYNEYRSADNQHLFGFMEKEEMIGSIGIEIDQLNCEIKYIAVLPNVRGKGIGSQMIDWVRENFSIQKITAETDNDA